jgi:hypothetical protein
MHAWHRLVCAADTSAEFSEQVRTSAIETLYQHRAATQDDAAGGAQIVLSGDRTEAEWFQRIASVEPVRTPPDYVLELAYRRWPDVAATDPGGDLAGVIVIATQ